MRQVLQTSLEHEYLGRPQYPARSPIVGLNLVSAEAGPKALGHSSSFSKWKGRLSREPPHYKVRNLPNYGLQSKATVGRRWVVVQSHSGLFAETLSRLSGV